jgi:hypothetical protein
VDQKNYSEGCYYGFTFDGAIYKVVQNDVRPNIGLDRHTSQTIEKIFSYTLAEEISELDRMFGEFVISNFYNS